MNAFLRAAGFSRIEKKRDEIALRRLVKEMGRKTSVIRKNDEDEMITYRLQITDKIGIQYRVIRSFETEYEEFLEPYYLSTEVQSYSPCTIEKRIGGEKYTGIIEDSRVGINIIFYTIMDELILRGEENEKKTVMEYDRIGVSLTGISTEGKIILPIRRTPRDRQLQAQEKERRLAKLRAADQGDVDAIQQLTLQKMDEMNVVYDRMLSEDLLSIVDNNFMPFGLECDSYAVIGEIQRVEQRVNPYTGEKMYELRVEMCDMPMDILIHEKDLFGEPMVGRRFKGSIWLQGRLAPDAVSEKVKISEERN